MVKVHKLQEEPTLDNTVMKSEQINTRPIFANKTQAAEMFGVGKSTIYRWLAEAEDSGDWPGLSIRPSPTITLIDLEMMERFVRSKNKTFL